MLGGGGVQVNVGGGGAKHVGGGGCTNEVWGGGVHKLVKTAVKKCIIMV